MMPVIPPLMIDSNVIFKKALIFVDIKILMFRAESFTLEGNTHIITYAA
ncbi:MAG: hypothetical protein ACTTH8_03260 [Treponema sp.]